MSFDKDITFVLSFRFVNYTVLFVPVVNLLQKSRMEFSSTVVMAIVAKCPLKYLEQEFGRPGILSGAN